MTVTSYSHSARAWLVGCLTAAGAVGCGGGPAGEGEGEGGVGLAARVAGPGCGTRHVSAERGSDVGPSGAPNDCRGSDRPCLTVQRAADAACPGDRVSIGRGEYRENVVVRTPLALEGSGRATVLYPATSAPAPCEESSLCGGAASNVILVEADDVAVRDLAIDGDNPGLTSGVVVGGADLDARNGVITNNLLGAFGNLRVERVSVRNVFLRGVQVGNGGSFVVRHSRVRNVRGSDRSVAIFNFGAAGEVEGNVVSEANDAISSNHSRGTRVVGNWVYRSGSGVHTDNAGDPAGSSPDLVAGNAVAGCSAGGYGVWALLPYVAPSVRDNLVLGCAVGLAAFGQGAPVTTTFAGNLVDGRNAEGSIGFVATNDQLGFGAGDASVDFAGNALLRNAYGAYLEQLPGLSLDVDVTCSAIALNDTGVAASSEAGPIAGSSVRASVIAGNDLVGVDATAVAGGPFDATGNFWGCLTGPGSGGCDDVAGDVLAVPFLPLPLPACGGADATARAGRAARLAPALDDGEADRAVAGGAGDAAPAGREAPRGAHSL